jgi:hypothetical protein
MNPILKNILAVVAGLVAGSIINMGIIKLGAYIIPPPEGVIPGDMESLKEHMPNFGLEQFIVPFLAHALGTLAGAWLTATAAAAHQMKLALGIGAWFLLGGVAVSFMLPAPIWFSAIDIIVAYLPMGYLGWKLAGSK